MTEIRISGATLRAWRGGHNRTYRDLERAGRAGTEAAETEAEIAGLRAAITQWLAEQPVQQDRASVPHPVVQPVAQMRFDQLAAQQGVKPIRDVSELAIGDLTEEERAAYLAALEPDPLADLHAALTDEHGRHRYLSTGCYHRRHDYCAAMTGYQGEKRPARCKWCEARCDCRCHSCPTCSGPVRETVGMICQTCGTDYSTPAVAGAPEAPSKDQKRIEEDR